MTALWFVVLAILLGVKLGDDTRIGDPDRGYDWFGYSISDAGDVDGDGYDDVIIGAPEDDQGSTASGSAHVYRGTAKGLDVHRRLTASDHSEGARLGAAVSGAGDIDGDGFDDVIVGAPGDFRDEGAAYVFFGGRNGIDTDREDKLTESAFCYQFGDTVASAGDVNGDGFGDVIVSSRPDPELDCEAAAVVYHGGRNGLSEDAESVLQPGWAAVAASGAGDVNGDGYDDVIVGQGELDVAYVYLGTPDGLVLGTEIHLKVGGLSFGVSVSSAGDVNDDGFDDVIVGAFGGADSAALVYLGSAEGIDPDSEMWLSASDGAPTDAYGYSVSGIGDVDGDGFDDVIVAASLAPATSGAAYVYFGGDGGIEVATEIKYSAANNHWSDGNFGHSVSGAGDVDGDGLDDLMISTYGAVYGTPCQKSAWHLDEDGDGYGSAETVRACSPPEGYVDNADDCDDTTVNINPKSDLVCRAYTNGCQSAECGCNSGGGAASWLLVALAIGLRRRTAQDGK